MLKRLYEAASLGCHLSTRIFKTSFEAVEFVAKSEIKLEHPEIVEI